MIQHFCNPQPYWLMSAESALPGAIKYRNLKVSQPFTKECSVDSANLCSILGSNILGMLSQCIFLLFEMTSS